AVAGAGVRVGPADARLLAGTVGADVAGVRRGPLRRGGAAAGDDGLLTRGLVPESAGPLIPPRTPRMFYDYDVRSEAGPRGGGLAGEAPMPSPRQRRPPGRRFPPPEGRRVAPGRGRPHP